MNFSCAATGEWQLRLRSMAANISGACGSLHIVGELGLQLGPGLVSLDWSSYDPVSSSFELGS